MIKLLGGRLGNISSHGGVGCRWLCTIGLDDLTWNFFLAPKDSGSRAMLAVHDSKVPSLDGRNDNGRELRPVEVFRNLIYVECTAPANFTLIGHVHNKLVDVNPFQKWSRSR